MSSSDEDDYPSAQVSDDDDYDAYEDQRDSGGEDYRGWGFEDDDDSEGGQQADDDPPPDQIREAYNSGYEDGFADGVEGGSRVDDDEADAFDAEADDSKTEPIDNRVDDDDYDDDSDDYEPAPYINRVHAVNPPSATTSTFTPQSSHPSAPTISVSHFAPAQQLHQQAAWNAYNAPSAPQASTSQLTQYPQHAPYPAQHPYDANAYCYDQQFVTPGYEFATYNRSQQQQMVDQNAQEETSSVASTRISISRSQYESLTNHLQRLDFEIQDLRQRQNTASQSTKQRDKQGQSCFNCHQFGHLARCCPFPSPQNQGHA
ncbi:unnamed protein product [Tilletia controversa]|uniref:CCHC-type domain-containing protein n=1 Tax=Tilletia controversa TaxID=13291 RepID=A0A8X7SSV7_9BASI|nr:hypothetical protein CF328_g7975 [Tilletia controversa]KAE8238701.1 hypothetical protein A4X06_0g8657 [Tilletia controversa]CAD6920257.1 unnamed protein product [Tilletia controversa]CAD6971790.1 unnamed protein product [Tilletia controversa]